MVEKKKNLAKEEERLKTLKAEIRDIEEKELPDAMRACNGMTRFDLKDGSQIKVKDDIFCSIPLDKKADALKWLEENGHAGLIKHDVKVSFAKGEYGSRIDDGLSMHKAMITNAVRCVPPQNKTIGEEETNCRPFLIEQIEKTPSIKIILALGGVAHNAVLSTYGEKKSAFKFAHNQTHTLSNGLKLIDSYHCSRYNTNTGRLTTEMFEDVFKNIQEFLG